MRGRTVRRPASRSSRRSEASRPLSRARRSPRRGSSCPRARSAGASRSELTSLQPDRRARGDSTPLLDVARAEERDAADRVRDRDDVERLRPDARAGRRARRRALARPRLPSAGASGTSTFPGPARGSGRRSSPPGGTLSCVTPATPSSAFGRSTPCQWIETPCRTSRFTSVASTSSPSRTRSSGPGRRPLNVSALTLCPTAAGPSRSARRAGCGRPEARPGPCSAATETPCACPPWCSARGPPP